MAVDPDCPRVVLEAVMRHPTAQRLAYLANLTERDLETDLSCLIALALAIQPLAVE